MTERKLTQKRELFAQGIVEGLTAADAYRRAYSVARMKPASVQAEAGKLRAIPTISLRIEALQEALRKRAEKTVDDIDRELLGVAFANLSDVVSWSQDHFHIVPSEELPDHVRAAVKSVKVKRRTEITGSITDPHVWEVQEITFTMHDKLKALELAGKHRGMWPQKPPEINVSFPIQVQENISRLRSMSIDELRSLAAVPVIEFPGDDDE